MRHLILHIFGVRVWGAPSWREKRQGGDIRYYTTVFNVDLAIAGLQVVNDDLLKGM